MSTHHTTGTDPDEDRVAFMAEQIKSAARQAGMAFTGAIGLLALVGAALQIGWLQ